MTATLSLPARPRAPRGPASSQCRLDHAARQRNRHLPTPALLALLREQAPEFFQRAEVIGSWVWIQFPDRQPPTVTRRLSEFGFHWNNQRQVWQHPCGQTTQNRFEGDPRQRYGSLIPSQSTAN